MRDGTGSFRRRSRGRRRDPYGARHSNNISVPIARVVTNVVVPIANVIFGVRIYPIVCSTPFAGFITVVIANVCRYRRVRINRSFCRR
jgi:hypothetical protein